MQRTGCSMDRIVIEKQLVHYWGRCGSYISDGLYLIDLLETSSAKRPKGRANEVSCR
jgi:hypothetical protein